MVKVTLICRWHSPAAMRYRGKNVRFQEIMADIEKETVDFQLNFDDTV
jgi:DNA gyrase subunit A